MSQIGISLKKRGVYHEKDYYSVFKAHQAVLRPAKVKAKAACYIPVEIQGPTLS